MLISVCVDCQQLIKRNSVRTLCAEAELLSQTNMSSQERATRSHGPACWKWWSCRIPVLTLGSCSHSLPGEPKSLPQHPWREDYSLGHVCSAALALCRRIEPSCSCFQTVFSLSCCLVSLLTAVCNFICSLFGFQRAFQRIDGAEVKRLRTGSYLRKSHVSGCIVSQWCQHVQ